MSPLQSLKTNIRASILRYANLRRMRHFLNQLPPGGPPIFILANPADVHFAPFAVLIRSGHYRHVLVANGLSDQDVSWLSNRCPGIPILRLSASLTGNASSYLSHGELVNLLALSLSEPFFIQDADCFVLSSRFFEALRIPGKNEYAAGPWWKTCPDWTHILPDTFFVGINPTSLARIRTHYGVDAAIVARLSSRSKLRLQESGLPEHWRPELSYEKDYFDTLQLSWILASLDGENFGLINGGADLLHHVGGTSYLAAKANQDLAHWDWWPLNTCYTTLRVLETPGWDHLNDRFAHLRERFGDAEKIEREFPDFTSSNRYKETQRILKILK